MSSDLRRGPSANSSICSYKVTKGLLDRFGEKRVIDSPITESGFAGLTVGAALAGLHPVVCLGLKRAFWSSKLTLLQVRIHDLQFRHASDRSDHQFGCQNTLHVWWHPALQHHFPRSQWVRFRCRSPAFPRLHSLVRKHTRPQSRSTVEFRRCEGTAQGRHQRPESCLCLRKRVRGC